MISDESLRVDARRNIERLLQAATRLLGENPAASMEQIAVEAEVHRSTVYRRFPTRDALVQALLVRATAEAAALVADTSRRDPDVTVLRDLLDHMIQLGEHYAFLHTHYHLADLGPDPIGITKLVRRYQRARVLRRDIPAEWLASTLTAIGAALIADRQRLLDAGRPPGHLFAELFLNGAGPRPIA